MGQIICHNIRRSWSMADVTDKFRMYKTTGVVGMLTRAEKLGTELKPGGDDLL